MHVVGWECCVLFALVYRLLIIVVCETELLENGVYKLG